MDPGLGRKHHLHLPGADPGRGKLYSHLHEGEGKGSKSDIYTNSSAPLWIDNLVSLQDADGSIISTYDVSTAPAAAAWSDSLAKQIQY